MKRWELTRYLIDAKKNIDTIMFIKLNQNKLSNIDINDKIGKVQMEFYIKLCIILDNVIKRSKKDVCQENRIINSIYYERDKDKAHKDKNYKKHNYNSYNEIIRIMKNQLNEVKIIASECLPQNITINYVPHDKELFRLIYGVNKEKEYKINKEKYDKPIIVNQKRITKKVFFDIDEIKDMPEDKKNEFAVIVKNGINIFEGIQERQDACIKINLLYNLNCWAEYNEKNISKWIGLKTNGFIDEFDKPRNIAIWSNEMWQKFYNIMNEEE